MAKQQDDTTPPRKNNGRSSSSSDQAQFASSSRIRTSPPSAPALGQARVVRFPSRVEDPNEVEGSTFIEELLETLLSVVSTCCAVWCIGGLLTILVVLYLTVRPFSHAAYRRLASHLGAASFLDAYCFLLPNTTIYLTADSDFPSPVGTSILVCNHVCDADWWALLQLGRCIGLRGTLRAFLRNEYLHVDMHQQPNGTNGNGTNGNGATDAAHHHYPSPSSSMRKNGDSLVNVSSSKVTTSSSPTQRNHSDESSASRHVSSQDLTVMAKLLHLFLDFPLLSGEDASSDREHLFPLLRSFTETTASPVQLLFFPEGCSVHAGQNRQSILARSNEFAKREGRPQLKHLLLPRNRVFYASLECLRESSPHVYDVTMAYNGYDGSLPPGAKLSLVSLWNILRGKFPREVHLRIKRYSMEEVLQDPAWLDKKWAEKDRLLSHFIRKQSFGPHREFDTRHSMENSFVALVRLVLVPCAVPVLLVLSIPLFWTLLWIWLAHQTVRHFMSGRSDTPVMGQTPVSAPTAGTPTFPATPFASPSVTAWRDVLSSQQQQQQQPRNGPTTDAAPN